jgi:diguanylate cyclase (GGDEF)-like protein
MDQIPLAVQQKLKACRTLPSVPAVVLEVLDLCRQDDIAIPRVAKVLARDPALSAKVLKVANSAWYGVRSQVTTLDRALALLGINATLSLALSFSFVRGLRKTERAHFDHQSYWRRSTIAAVASRVVGSCHCSATADELFVAGLLQDIGELALNEAMPDTYAEIITEANGRHQQLIEVERRLLFTDHAAVGAWLLETWGLPEKLRETVAGSHHDDRAGRTPLASFAASVALGGRIAEIWTIPENAAAAADAREASIRIFDVQEEQFDKMLGEIAAALPEVTANLEVDIGGEEAINRFLEQAREALVMLSLQAQQQAREFRIQSQCDRLTGLYNRAYLDDAVPSQFIESMRSGRPLSVVFIDLDHFKKINDSFGHPAGDQVLISVAQVLKATLRTSDIIGRYGGEEFLCILPNTSGAAAALVAERLREAVAGREHPIGDGVLIPVTISAGCATLSGQKHFPDSRDLVEAADRCLYEAKRGGRNRIAAIDGIEASDPDTLRHGACA